MGFNRISGQFFPKFSFTDFNKEKQHSSSTNNNTKLQKDVAFIIFAATNIPLVEAHLECD